MCVCVCVCVYTLYYIHTLIYTRTYCAVEFAVEGEGAEGDGGVGCVGSVVGGGKEEEV